MLVTVDMLSTCHMFYWLHIEVVTVND